MHVNNCPSDHMATRTPTEMLAEIKAETQLSEIGLAKRLDISQPTVNRILRGQEGCSSKVLLAIQRVYAEVVAGKGESSVAAPAEPHPEPARVAA